MTFREKESQSSSQPIGSFAQLICERLHFKARTSECHIGSIKNKKIPYQVHHITEWDQVLSSCGYQRDMIPSFKMDMISSPDRDNHRLDDEEQSNNTMQTDCAARSGFALLSHGNN
jgi:hypothetical protein